MRRVPGVIRRRSASTEAHPHRREDAASPMIELAGWGGTRRIGSILIDVASNAAAAAFAKAFPSPRTVTRIPEKSCSCISSLNVGMHLPKSPREAPHPVDSFLFCKRYLAAANLLALDQ
jgi:hypothetical protein